MKRFCLWSGGLDSSYLVYDSLLIPDGFEEAFVGFCTQFNNTFALFDRHRCIKILIDDGMTEEEAEEYFEYNIQGAWVGNTTPAFIFYMKIDKPKRKSNT